MAAEAPEAPEVPVVPEPSATTWVAIGSPAFVAVLIAFATKLAADFLSLACQMLPILLHRILLITLLRKVLIL